MSKTMSMVLVLVVGLAIGIPLGGRMMPSMDEAADATMSAVYSAVPGAIGAQDISGPYEIVEGWPQDISELPDHEDWTWGAARGIFAESPDRVYLLGSGELPNIQRPAGDTVSRGGSQRAVSDQRTSVAKREFRRATEWWRVGPGPGSGHGRLERRVASVSRTRRGRADGAPSCRRQRDGRDHRGMDTVGRSIQAAALRLRQPLRSREACLGCR